MKFEEVGCGAARSIISKCTNKYCDIDNALKHYPRKFSKHYAMNVSTVYENLLQDSGFVGYVRGNQARGLPILSKKSRYEHAKDLYNVMDEFYDKNIVKVHDDVKSFFTKHFKIDPNFKGGEFLDLCVYGPQEIFTITNMAQNDI